MYRTTHINIGAMPAPVQSAIDSAAGFVDGLPAWAKAALVAVGVLGLVKRF